MTWWNPDELESRTREMFQGMITDLDARSRPYSVDSSEVDEELMTLFQEHIRGIVSPLLSAISERSEMDIRREAHSLLGMGGTIGVPTLSVVAEELSAGAKRGDYSRCRELAERLQEWVRVCFKPCGTEL